MLIDCDDCAVAYKAWLCAVAFPRCDDFNSTNPRAHVRNVAQPFPNGTALSAAAAGKFGAPAEQASRNPFIDEGVAPGPYKEILPCDDLCYRVVQDCPAELGFSCPQPGLDAFEHSYGQRQESKEGAPPCNFPGGSTAPSGAGRMAVSWVGAGLGVGVAMAMTAGWI